MQSGSRGGNAFRYQLDGKDVLREWLRTTSVYSITAGSVALRPRDLERLQGLSYPVGSQQVTDYAHGIGSARGLVAQTITETQYLRWDGRGATGQVEGPDGSVRASQVYDAYGLLRTTGTLDSFYGFVGEEGVRQEKTPPNSPYHMRARVYDPILCRFTSRDPLWSENLFQYAEGNPWSNVDPEGLQSAPSRRLRADIDPDGSIGDFLGQRGWDNFSGDNKLVLMDLLTLLKSKQHGSIDLSRHDELLVQSFWRRLFESEIQASRNNRDFQKRAGSWLADGKLSD